MQDPALMWRKNLLLVLVAVLLLWGASAFAPALPIGALACLLCGLLGFLILRDQRRMSEQLRLQRLIIDQTSEAMMLTDPEQRIMAVNPAFERVTGYSAAEVVGQTPLMLGAGRHGADFYQAIWARVADQGSWEGEVWDRRKGGEIYPKQMRIRTICAERASGVAHYVAVFSDISAQKAQEARIDYLAHHDPLTSLPNRLAMDLHLADALGNAVRGGSRLAVLIIDLDNFKTVNDSLGHHAGDQLLGEIARRLLLELDWRGRLFRLGGDEFVVVLEEVDQTERVIELLERLVKTVGEPCQVLGHQLHTSPSIGVSFFPTDGESAETLIRNADTAMYYAKASGRSNFQFFAEPMNVAVNKRLHLESELWDALAQNQLLLHYQPQVDLVSGSVVGVEALVRWLHPQRGMIAPDDFIPVAEECGLILPLGHWVLLTACRQAKSWLDAGIDVGEMAVNISAHQFRQPDFAQTVRAVLLETGLPAERLELEITESTVMHSADSSIRTLATLKEMGIKLAIDDFGTGYSSLSYLRLFPVDRLKIDRTFVADVESDSDAASLVTSIIALGRSLGLNLVAEGVETPAQAEFLRALDCQRVQGFHFFRPVVAEEVAAVSDFFRLDERLA
jgi:diguanylate cyclase (GGDEF)-like protein/PAS domain S-box-containing protein